MATSAPTRRSSRRRVAESAIPVEIEVTSSAEESVVLGAVVADAAQPLSRRAARERQRAAARAKDAAEPVVVVTAATVANPAEPAAAAADTAEPAKSAPEPATSPSVEASADEPVVPVADAFTEASRAFRSLNADAPRENPAPVEDALPAEATTTHVAPRKRRAGRKLVAFGATVGVMGVAGMLAVSMTLPAEAIAAVQGVPVKSATSLIAGAETAVPEGAEDEIQAFVASSDLQNEVIDRPEDFSTASLVDIAAERGIHFSDELYTNDPDAAIQWPFVVGVGMSFGYGMRSGRMHEGIDLVPGAGAPVQSIADGTVRIATESGGNYGVTVYIDHVIDEKVVTSHYSHMQYGSLRVVAGQKVKVGDIIGEVGNTGRSYGAHMHFELIVDDVKIDPLPWMQANAGRYDY